MMNLFTLGFKVTSDGFDELQGNISNITNAVGGLAAAFTSLQGIQLGKELVKEFAEAETQSMRLRGAVQGVGLNYAQLKPQIDATIDSMMELTTIEDDAASGALARLVSVTRDMDKSLRGLKVAQEFAARGMMDLEGAAVLIGKAINGNTTMLKRYGIEVSDTGDVLAELEHAFTGVAEAQANTLGGAMQQSSVQIGNFREALGQTIAETFNLDGAIRGVTGVFRDANGEFEPFATSLLIAVGTVGTLTAAVYGLGTAFAALRTAIAAAGATTFIATLTNPVVIAGLIALTAAVGVYSYKSQKAADATNAFRESLEKKSVKILSAEQKNLEEMIGTLQKDVNESMRRFGAADISFLEEAKQKREMYTEAIKNATARERAEQVSAEMKKRQAAAEERQRIEAGIRAEQEAFDTRTKLINLTVLNAQSIKKMTDEAAKYEAIAAQSNISERRRVELLERAKKIRDELAQQTVTERVTLGKTSQTMQVQAGFAPETGFGKSGGMAALNKSVDEQLLAGRKAMASQVEGLKIDVDAIVADVQNHSTMKFLEMRDSLAGNLEAAFAEGLGQSIYDAFASAFSGKGIGGLFETFGRSVLKGLGKIFVMMGQYMIGASGIFKGLAVALSNPITSGPALAAYGALLIALGAGMGAIATRGEDKGGSSSIASAAASRGGSGFENSSQRMLFGTSSGTVAAGMSPRQNINVSIIGTDDPKAQREIMELFNNARDRGSL